MIEIRQIDLQSPGELEEALTLADSVFNVFEAPEYSPEGVKEFHNFTKPELIRPRIESNDMQMWIAILNGNIIGLIALRNANHISMFFVDGSYHRQGVGRMLYNAARDHICSSGRNFATVYASPYGIPAYENLGFIQLTEEQKISGLRCNPMASWIGK